MTHITFHLAAGMLVASAVSMPGVLRKWRLGEKMSGPTMAWIALSVTLGLLACVPSLLRRAGLSDPLCDGWWMNLFLFYPVLKRLPTGGLPGGLLLMSIVFSAQYACILIALRRLRRTHSNQRPITV